MANEPKKGFTWEDADKSTTPAGGKGFSWESQGPDISSEASMAAHPPAARPMEMQQTAHPKAIEVANQVAHPLNTTRTPAEAGKPWFEQPSGLLHGHSFSTEQFLDSPAGKGAQEAGVNAAKFGADTLMGGELLKPIATLAETHALPALKALPFAGKVIRSIDEAPGILGKVTRGAATGGAVGGVEGLIRGHGLEGSAKDAAEGAGYGAAGGLILPGIHKLSGMEPEPDLRPIKGPSTPVRQSPNFNANEYNAGRKAATVSAPTPTPETHTEGVEPPQSDVVKVPVPRALTPGEKVGYNASTPRKLILDNALQGRPGAAEMLRNMGKTPLFVEEGGYAPPREKITIGAPAEQTHSRITLNPIGKTGARPIVSPESQFESSFGPEHQEVGDLAEWETGSREGVRPKKPILVP